MFIKAYNKYNKTTNEYYWYYKLVESYRKSNTICHRVIVNFGRLETLTTATQRNMLAQRIGQLVTGGGQTLSTSLSDQEVERLAAHFYIEIKAKGTCDIKPGDWDTVNLTTLKNKDGREIGAEWLCKQAFDQLGIGSFLQQSGWDDQSIALATTDIICRAVYPASELKTVSYIKENSAVCEITGYDRDKITKDKLYGISHKLYKIKDPLEQYLSKQTNELFDLDDKIILYDLTNTYFEGQVRGSKIAKFGRSKEKRSDARIIVLAVVVKCWQLACMFSFYNRCINGIVFIIYHLSVYY